jgi:hypothetical protein
MSDDLVKLLDAMKEEIDTLNELETVYNIQQKFLPLCDVIVQRQSLQRIVTRFEDDIEYYMAINKDGNPKLKTRQKQEGDK